MHFLSLLHFLGAFLSEILQGRRPCVIVVFLVSVFVDAVIILLLSCFDTTAALVLIFGLHDREFLRPSSLLLHGLLDFGKFSEVRTALHD